MKKALRPTSTPRLPYRLSSIIPVQECGGCNSGSPLRTWQRPASATFAEISRKGRLTPVVEPKRKRGFGSIVMSAIDKINKGFSAAEDEEI